MEGCEEGGYFSSERFTKTCYDDAVLLALAKFPLEMLKDELKDNIEKTIYKGDISKLALFFQVVLNTNAMNIQEISTKIVEYYNILDTQNIIKSVQKTIENGKPDVNMLLNVGKYIKQLTQTLDLRSVLYIEDHNKIPNNINKNVKTLIIYTKRVDFDVDDNSIGPSTGGMGVESSEPKELNEWDQKEILMQETIKVNSDNFKIVNIISLSKNSDKFSVYVFNPCKSNWASWDVINATRFESTCKTNTAKATEPNNILKDVSTRGLIYVYANQKYIEKLILPSSPSISASILERKEEAKIQESNIKQLPEAIQNAYNAIRNELNKLETKDNTKTTLNPILNQLGNLGSNAKNEDVIKLLDEVIQNNQNDDEIKNIAQIGKKILETSLQKNPLQSIQPPQKESEKKSEKEIEQKSEKKIEPKKEIEPPSAPSTPPSTPISIPEKYVPMDTKTRIEEIKQNMPNDHHLNSSVASLRFVELSLQCVKPTTNQRSIDYGTFKSMGNLCILQGDASLKEAPIGTLVVLSISGQSNQESTNQKPINKITTIYMKIDRETYITLNNYYGFDPAGESTLYVDGIGKFTVKGIIFKQ